MIRCFQRVCRLEVRLLDEQPATFREEEHNNKEDEEENAHAEQIVHGVVRMERNSVFGDAVFVLVLLDIDTVGVVGAHFVQCQDVKHYQAQQNDRQCHYVQREESVEGNTGNQVVTTNPEREVLTDHGDSPEQVNDNLRTPVGHLAPRQEIAHERFSHQDQVDQHTEDPDQLTRLLIGAVHQPPEHVEIDHNKEGRGTGRMQVTQQPTPLDITHDVFNGCECAFRRRVVAHGQPDSRDQLVHENQHREGTKEVPQVEVFRRVVLAKVLVPGINDRKPFVYPVE